MKTVTLFDERTGLFGRVLMMPDHAIAANVPDGFGFKEGRFDKHSQRVDVETGEVIAYERPQAEVDRERREVRRADSQREVEVIERDGQRALREAVLLLLPDGPLKDRIKADDDAIAAKRPDLQR